MWHLGYPYHDEERANVVGKRERERERRKERDGKRERERERGKEREGERKRGGEREGKTKNQKHKHKQTPIIEKINEIDIQRDVN